MELGCDGVLMNTAIAEAKDPVRMARAMKLAVEAGRDAYLAGRMATRKYADPSSRWRADLSRPPGPDALLPDARSQEIFRPLFPDVNQVGPTLPSEGSGGLSWPRPEPHR
jgi:hypothetical protein